VFDYKAVADNQSMLNTPPTFAWYMAGSGLQVAEEKRRRGGDGRAQSLKAQMLYAAIDARANLPEFGRRRCALLDERDVHAEQSRLDELSAAGGAAGLQASRVIGVGGMRASLYNAMPLAGVEALIAFMREFERGTHEVKP
jgi:phosphoserine aminotransferase